MDTTTGRPDDSAEAGLSSVSDDEWRAAHDRLMAEMLAATEGTSDHERVADQFAYDWAPARPGDIYVSLFERDIAPRDWRPGDPDERFDGGGYRG